MITKFILINTLILISLSSYGQEQTFVQNEEKARSEELRLGIKSHVFLCELKEGAVSTDLFNSISEMMELKDGYISIKNVNGKLRVTASTFITTQDLEGVINQFGQNFVVHPPSEVSLLER